VFGIVKYNIFLIKTDVRRHVKKITEQEISKSNFSNDSNGQTMALVKEKDCYITKADKSNEKLIQDGPCVLMSSNPLNKMTQDKIDRQKYHPNHEFVTICHQLQTESLKSTHSTI
jgi:hypothetical protein